MYDVIVIGGGPAGMSAGIYLARKKLKTLLLTKEFGGQASKASEVENYLGYTKISGPELLAKFVEHLENIGVESRSGVIVEEITKTENGFLVKTDNESFETKTVLVASGKVPRQLDVPGENEYMGKGVSYCAICDGPLFHDKTVVVVGGGNSALDAAIEIEKYAKKVVMMNLNEDFQGDEVRKDHVKQSEKIEVLSGVKVVEIVGEQFVKAIKYQDIKSEKTSEVAADGIFVEIGWAPATDFMEKILELNDLKEIDIDLENATSVPGIFAAGDVTNVKEKQIIIAAGEGAKAALNVWQYIIKNRLMS